MAFSANPLSLSVPEASFESWLRDTGYLEILDSHSTAAASAAGTTDASPPPPLHKTAAAAATSTAASLLSSIKTLTSLLSVNPFARLVSADLSGPTPPWTGSFLGRPSSYSFPAGPAQARMRVQENVKRYARNYAFLSLLFFACSLYRNPVSLLGCLLCLALWEMVRFACSRWDMEERYPTLRQLLVRLVQLATGVILYSCSLQVTLIYTIGVSYTVMIMHASLRKLAPIKQATGSSWHRRSQQRKTHTSAR